MKRQNLTGPQRKNLTEPRTKRGYSRDFTPRTEAHARYLLDKIPPTLWADVKAKAKREGVSMRALILSLLTHWLKG